MEARELRIGNWIEVRYGGYEGVWKTEVIRVTDILHVDGDGPYEHHINCHPNDYCEPIPLTVEWLVRAGFKQWGTYLHLWKVNPRHGFTVHLRSGKFTLNEYGYSQRNGGISYVHQLQNLYYALTGQELIFKE